MNRILATSAVALMMGSTAFAADIKPLNTVETNAAADIFASELNGMSVYATKENIDVNAKYGDSATRDWDEIGEVEDVLLTLDGKVKAVIIGVGGFLDIGDHDVAISMDQLHMVTHEEGTDRRLVVNATEETLRDAQPFERRDRESMESNGGNAAQSNTQGDSENQMAKADDDTQGIFDRPDVEREGYREADREELTAENLKGADVYSSKTDEDIGDVDRLVLGDDGQIKHVIIDIGGFLGLGDHTIGLKSEEIRILRGTEDDDLRVYLDATKEQLEAREEYKD